MYGKTNKAGINCQVLDINKKSPPELSEEDIKREKNWNYFEKILSKDSIIFSRNIGLETKSLNPVAMNFSLSPGRT